MSGSEGRKTKDVANLLMHGEESRYDFSLDMRIHLRAKSAEEAVRKADRIADFISTKLPGVWLTVKRYKEKKR